MSTSCEIGLKMSATDWQNYMMIYESGNDLVLSGAKSSRANVEPCSFLLYMSSLGHSEL